MKQNIYTLQWNITESETTHYSKYPEHNPTLLDMNKQEFVAGT